MNLDIGKVISESARVYRSELLTLTVLAALWSLPGLLLRLSAADDVMVTSLSNVLDTFLGAVGSAFVVYIAIERLGGRKPSMARVLSVGLARMLSVLGATLLIGAAVFGAMLLCGLLLGALNLLSPALMIGVAIPVAIGIMWFWVSFYVAVPVVVAEGASAVDALTRSRALTAHSQGRLVGLFVIMFVLIGLLGAAIGIAVPADSLELATYLLTVPFSALMACTPAVAYIELRTQREGESYEDLAAIFD